MKKMEFAKDMLDRHLDYCKPINKSNKRYRSSGVFGKIIKYKNENCPEMIKVGKKFIEIKLGFSTRKSMAVFLCDNFDDIILSEPKELINFEKDFYLLLYNEEICIQGLSPVDFGYIKTYSNKFLKYIFNYDSFSNKSGGYTWSPYDFIINLNQTICPYCNAQFTFTVKRDLEIENEPFSIRPHLDHFFAKSIHPMLALSVYNLIPSCYTCNSSLKRDYNCVLEEQIHPYIDDLDEMGYFRREFETPITKVGLETLDYYSAIVGRGTSYKIKLESNDILFKKKIKGFEDLFKIEGRYLLFKELLNQNIKKALIYNELYSFRLHESYRCLFDENESFDSMFINTDINNNILSKLQNDILKKEFGFSRK
ncbi:hypothetical protein [Sporosarcina sp. SG10008]|uniref:hypothetical protein n=1 Tax=Sporosarcina sp. SG10008 TaxID=3373103 RepID=UPI0037DC4E66